MIFNTDSNSNQDNILFTNSNYYSESTHLCPYSDFKDAALIKNMFIGSDGSLCKSNSIKSLYSHSGSQIANSYYFTNNDKSQDVIYYIEDSDKKGKNEKSYINAISYDEKNGTCAKVVANLALPSPTKKYKFYSSGNNMYAIGNDEVYTYSHLSETGFQSASPYVPLIQKMTNRLGNGISYESINLLECKKVRIRSIADGATRDFKINFSVASVDAVYIGGSLLDRSQYSVSIYTRYSIVTTASVYKSSDTENDMVEIWFTLLSDTYSDIRNPNGIIELKFEDISVPCIYTDTCVYICGYSDCESVEYNINPLYFPSDNYAKIDISSLGAHIQNVVPLNNNRFAVITTDYNILIYKISKSIKTLLSSDIDKVIYILKAECVGSFSNPQFSNTTHKSIGYNENNIYIGYNNIIYDITIDESNSFGVLKKYISSNIQLYLNEKNITLSDYKIYYCSKQDYIYLYNSQYDTIVYDTLNDCFYIYDGCYHIDSFINDSIFIGDDKLTFKHIVDNKYGTDDDAYILGYYQSKPLSLCTSESTKALNSIILKTESFETNETAISASATVAVETDLHDQITLSSDLTSAKVNIPTTSVYKSAEYDNFNDITIKISLSSNIYKLDKIIFDRDILDDIIPSINS